jgi:ribosome biogenesis GTPase
MQGVVYRSTGSWYNVKDENGKMWNARMKGIFKLDDITSTNPIAVGDIVDFDLENEGEQSVMITKIHDRRNYINRQVAQDQKPAAHRGGQRRSITSHCNFKGTPYFPGFIDRFLVACEMYHVPAIILFNKLDLYREKELAKLKQLKEMYEKIGYKVEGISLKDETTRTESIKDLLKDKITLLSGHSGVGKSTFINAVLPQMQLRTQHVSGWSGKGQHTTPSPKCLNCLLAARIIDTPGMKEFGLIGVERAEISGYFPEMKAAPAGLPVQQLSSHQRARMCDKAGGN